MHIPTTIITAWISVPSLDTQHAPHTVTGGASSEEVKTRALAVDPVVNSEEENGKSLEFYVFLSFLKKKLHHDPVCRSAF